MGEIYRARDTKLNRDVALKVLPGIFASNPERLSRFKREAQVLASLNHPNIAAIYGFEDGGGIHALVLELVDGQTLAEQIDEGNAQGRGLPLDETLSIARQIAEALEAAHEQGIVHRDLKPANVKLRKDGVVKVLDFGLAKALEPAVAVADVTSSPTITTPAMTGLGTLLGTAAYMSPEQAKGLQADKRSDVWAFGCVLYEMLTGSRLFDGGSVAETLASVLTHEPDWARLPASVPRSIRSLLRRCLERDRRKRMSDVAGALFALNDVLDTTAPEVGSSAPARTRFAVAGWMTAAVFAVVTAAVLVPLLRRAPVAASTTMRVQIVTGPTSDPVGFSLSPDGRSLVFAGPVNGRVQLLLRRLESDEDKPLDGTDGLVFPYPFWSPDSSSVAFFANGALKRIDLASGFVRTIASAPNARRGA
jgi:serine/threonine protein kinase